MADSDSGLHLKKATSQPPLSHTTSDLVNTDTKGRQDYQPPCTRSSPEMLTDQAASPLSAHITITGSIKTVPLEYYMSKVADSADFVETCGPIFRTSSGPILRSDRGNRIVLFFGCFNPQHLGHAALLWHAYLCTDDKTVAAIVILANAYVLSDKIATEVGTKSFKLTKDERVQLWQDPLVSHFAWVFPAENTADYVPFLDSLKEAMRDDGLVVRFPTLYGGGHSGRPWSFGRVDETIVGSDVARPVGFARGDYDAIAIGRSRKWRRVVGRAHAAGTAYCDSCWPCRKLKAICSDLFTDDETASKTASGNLLDVLRRCHKTQGVIWWAKNRRKEYGYKIFIPGGRRYTEEAKTRNFEDDNGAADEDREVSGDKGDENGDEDGDDDDDDNSEELEDSKQEGFTASSTMIRQLFFETDTNQDISRRSFVISWSMRIY